jgi:hypothetical protein
MSKAGVTLSDREELAWGWKKSTTNSSCCAPTSNEIMPRIMAVSLKLHGGHFDVPAGICLLSVLVSGKLSYVHHK